MEKIYDVIVVGGGPSAIASAIYTVRKGLKVAVIADSIGGQVITTNEIENIIGIPKTTGYEFTTNLEKHLTEYEVDVFKGHLVNQIKLENEYKLVITDNETYKTKSVILATGAKHRKLNVKGEDDFASKGVHYCATCDGPFYRNLDVVVVGGGNSGVEAALDLSNIAKSVTLIEYLDTLKADSLLQDKLKENEKINVILGAKLEEIKGTQFVTNLDYIDRKTNELKNIKTDGIFVEIGLLPSTDNFKDLVELNNRNEIKIDALNKTNVDGIFAAGDCTDVAYKQIIIALGDGAKAALSAFDYLLKLEK
ncbi:FAD-dependent oxidoreductase [Oceanivirga salmonicida]|uniref:FAD-dependent oxidoreductase n=1 Tax=Oceanivirga salmonicida TaxID=1769291 RepID=UPI000831FB9C|nr:FAD-dependent oxidoreductase [Oceanivirga salmonicida]